MPYFDVPYTVPVIVRVWLPEGPDDVPRVDRVVVIDEEITRELSPNGPTPADDRPTPAYPEAQPGGRISRRDAEKAHDVAETYEWPHWENGW